MFFQSVRPARIHAVEVFPASSGPTFSYGAPQQLFDAASYSLSTFGRTFDVSRDATRFLMVKPEGRDATAEIIVIAHWLDELKRRAPAPTR